MTALTLEKATSVSPSWFVRESGTLPFGGGRTSSSASRDFGTVKISQFRQKTVVLTGYQILVNLHKEFAESFQSRAKASQTMTVDASLDHPDLERAESRLEFLARLDLADSFESLSAPSADVFRDAGVLLRKLASAALDSFLPDLGLDSDGTIVFSFHPDRCGVIGSMSIFGDGTYSYCIEKEGISVECGSAPISSPIARDLQDFLER